LLSASLTSSGLTVNSYISSILVHSNLIKRPGITNKGGFI
jgi:arsenate reductase-like glutaredoxin family protein